MRELALFAGAGGGILGGQLLGWTPVCAVEIDAYCRDVLFARQRDGVLPGFPIWDDVTTFDGRPWRGEVDVISGGFPCQDISSAGKGAGIEGEKSGLWKEFARIIGEVRPGHVYVENSPDLTARGLGVVLGDLASMGFHARWGVLGACHAGAPHRRLRIWIHGHTHSKGESASAVDDETSGVPGVAPDSYRDFLRDEPGRGSGESGKGSGESQHDGSPEYMADAPRTQREPRSGRWGVRQGSPADGGGWWDSEPQLGRVANGVAHRLDRLRAIGNGQVPAVVRLAWEALK